MKRNPKEGEKVRFKLDSCIPLDVAWKLGYLPPENWVDVVQPRNQLKNWFFGLYHEERQPKFSQEKFILV